MVAMTKDLSRSWARNGVSEMLMQIFPYIDFGQISPGFVALEKRLRQADDHTTF